MKKYYLIVTAALLAACSCGNKPGTGTDPEPDPDPTPDPPVPVVVERPAFARGADISWVSEMEHDGKKFKKKDGTVADIFDVLKDCGMNAIRLRVWVDPYGGWSSPEDVVALGKRATAAGMALMVDFHYSDFFADPGRQAPPASWASCDLDAMGTNVYLFTRVVLEELQKAGVYVHWVQVGNETRNGMLWPVGQLWDNSGNLPNGRKNFVELYNWGYKAAKEVYPNALVMPHLNNAYDDNDWWFKDMKAAGMKMDAIALSHYPQAETKFTASQYNQKAVDNIKKLSATYGVPVIVSEVGVKPSKSDAASVMAAFMQSVKALDGCTGVFYWEPEVYGGWVPSVYKDADAIYKYTGKRETWGSYGQAAFTASGQPSAILDCFAP